MDIETIKSQLLDLATLIKMNLIREVERQGHRASGKLMDSIDVAIQSTVGGMSLIGRYVYYGRWVDTGRNAGVKRVPVDALIQWIRIKNIDLRGRKERDVAFAIQAAIYKNGIPTNRDMGKRRFMSSTLEKMEQVIFNKIYDAVFKGVELDIFNMIEKTQSSINSIQMHK
jgi:hypothetical protein